MKRIARALLFLCSWGLCLSAAAMDFAFHFNTEDDLKAWEPASGLAHLSLAPKYAFLDTASLRFQTPAWKPGMPERPGCQAKPLVADWTPYNKLILDVVNPHPHPQRLFFLLSDAKVPIEKGHDANFVIKGRGVTRCVVRFTNFPTLVDRKAVSVVRLFTERPETDMDIYIANAVLLKGGEKTPAVPDAFRPVLDELNHDALAVVRSAAAGSIMDMAVRGDGIPGIRAKIANAKRAFRRHIGDLESKFAAENLSLDRSEDLREELAGMFEIKRLLSVVKFHRDSARAGFDNPKMLVGTASSMVKVLPQGLPFDVQVARTVELSLARNEWESVQIAVMPRTDEALKNVTISVSPLKDKDGNTLERIDSDTVGFVRTLKHPPYLAPYVGWWPDPILPGCPDVTVKPDDIQTFWLRFHAGEKQPAGVYTGSLTVKAEGVEPVTLGLTIKVRDFNVPKNAPLPTAITFGFNQKQCCVKEPYDVMKFKYSDFLADYLIDYDHLYRKGSPDFDVIQRLHRQGRLVAFNLGNVFNDGIKEEEFEVKMRETVEQIRPAYEKAKELGLLEYAYIYGFDERGKDQFPLLERCAKTLREAFPEVLLMTTSYDNTYGACSGVETIDAWCPLTPVYQKTVDDLPAARAAGKYVWWYICCVPQTPFTNWFVESDAIESRLLMGAQTAKFRPDGFLYYQTSIWKDNTGIDCSAGPFTTWNPVSWTTYHGDGSLFYCDSDGNPLPSIRLENYRDGQEDYAYFCILEEAVRQVKAKETLTEAEAAWLKEAEAALVVPETLVKGMDDYSRDPQKLRAWRDHLADLIEASGFSAELNPWKGVFGVRGFHK